MEGNRLSPAKYREQPWIFLLTLLTALTALTADIVDEVDLVGDRLPTMSMWSILSVVNAVNLVNTVNAVNKNAALRRRCCFLLAKLRTRSQRLLCSQFPRDSPGNKLRVITRKFPMS